MNQFTIFDLADAFLSIEAMPLFKLQKLCYYAQAWHLAIYNEPLVDAQFEAWIHGAVNPELYQKYKSYDIRTIPRIADASKIPEHCLKFAKEVFEAYGSYSGEQLEWLIHREEPWLNARGITKPWEDCTEKISEKDMAEYYRKLMRE